MEMRVHYRPALTTSTASDGPQREHAWVLLADAALRQQPPIDAELQGLGSPLLPSVIEGESEGWELKLLELLNPTPAAEPQLGHSLGSRDSGLGSRVTRRSPLGGSSPYSSSTAVAVGSFGYANPNQFTSVNSPGALLWFAGLAMPGGERQYMAGMAS